MRNTYLESWEKSGIHGTHCGKCEKPFTEDETIFRAAIPMKWLGVYITNVGPICKECAEVTSKNMHGVFEPFGKCVICGRQIHISTASPLRQRRRVRVYCCEDHRQQMYRPKSVGQKAVCIACNSTFTPKRTDSKYCSSKCRQQAYRQKTKA